MRFTVLGPCRAFDGGSEIVLGRWAAAVLPVLVANANRPVPRQAIAQWLRDAGADLDADTVLRSLEDALGPGVIERGTDNAVLRSEPSSIDSRAFENEFNRARDDNANAEGAVELVTSALARWHGSAYDDCLLPAVRAEAARLDALRSEAQDLRFDLLLRQGRERDALELAEEMVRREPLREGAALRHVVALYRNSRRADAFGALHGFTEELTLKGQDRATALEGLELAMILERDVPPVGETSRTLQIGATGAPEDDNEPGGATERGLVGRWRERRLLRAFLRDVEEGSPRVMVLEGAPGIGKTRLATFLGD